jgi:hypothetical protein
MSFGGCNIHSVQNRLGAGVPEADAPSH